jgi:hypothetical protein
VNNNITKIVSVTLSILQTILAILLKSFGFIVPKTLEFCLAFQSFTFDRHLMNAIPEMYRPH